MRSGKIILGALGGLAAGALIGVFFAPDKGSESRNKIVNKGEDYLDSVKSKFNSCSTLSPENLTVVKLKLKILT